MSEKNKAKIDIGQHDMFFITKASLPEKVGVTPHSSAGAQLSKKAQEVKEDWENVLKELNYIVTETEKSNSNKNYILEEISVSLGFSAKGKIAFIAEAGIEASIQVTFKRK
jgi:hypothetical protein